MTTRYLLLALSDNGRATAYAAPAHRDFAEGDCLHVEDCANVAPTISESTRNNAQVFEVNAGGTTYSIDVMRMSE